ncbi:MAG: PKD domain-containing protein, partial [bacterium]
MNLKTVTILIVILLSHYIASSQTWNANFNGIDSIWQDLGGDPNIHVLKNINSELYLGGPFDNVGTQTVNGIAKYDSISWSGFNNGVDWGNVECIIEYKGEIVIGGNFTNADGQANTEAFAIWDGSNWYGLTGLQTTWVWDLEVYNDTLFIAYQLGDFKGIIAYDGISLLDVGNLNTNWVKTLIVYNDTLYAGGYSGFHKYMGGTLWEEAHGGTNERVNDMVVDTFNNFLYVGSGGFTVVGGYLPAYPVAIWDCFSWTSIGTIPNWAIYPKGMAIYRGDLYIGGYLDPYSGKTFNNIARWNGSVWDTLNGGCSAEVGALEVFKDELYVGGYFDYVDDTMRAYGLASWFVPDTGCGYLKPRVQTYIDTFYMSNGQAEVQFYNNNVYADSWSWDFGDTVTDTIKDPAHIYTEKGDYTVQVT